MNEEVGIIVGRFQTPYLHRGHQVLFTVVTQLHPRVLVFIGQSPLKCMANDPLDFMLRRWMIEEKYPNVEVHRIDDVFDPERWNRELDRQIALLVGPMQRVVLYGSRNSFLKVYCGKHRIEEIAEVPGESSTAVRRHTGIRPINHPKFREGVVWATQNQFPKVYATVDIAVVNVQEERILLGRKPGATQWRFPGGFSDIINRSFEEDAKRELVEETHLVATDIEYIGSTLIDDPRYANQKDKIKTLFFAVMSWDGTAVAGDDLEEIRWFDFSTFPLENELVSIHLTLFEMLREWLRKQAFKKNCLTFPKKSV